MICYRTANGGIRGGEIEQKISMNAFAERFKWSFFSWPPSAYSA